MERTESIPKRCPRCGGNQIQKFGFVPTVSEGKKRRWRCFDCGHTFYAPELE